MESLPTVEVIGEVHVEVIAHNSVNNISELDDHRELLSEDDASEETQSQGSSEGISEYGAAFLITNAALGAGLLNFPLAFHEAGGIVPGNFVHLFFVAATIGSLYIMAQIASKHKAKTYQEMVSAECGTFAGHFTSAIIAIYCLVTCVTFIIIVGDQTDRFFANIFGDHFCDSWWLRRTFTMLISGVFVLMLSLFRDMAKLLSMGLIGSIFMIYLVFVIIYVYLYGGYIPGPILIYDGNQLSHIFNVLPTICFGYQCHVSSVPIYYSIKNKNKYKYFKACTIAMVTCSVIYTLAANFGYLTFGGNVADDLLLSYDSKHAGSVLVNVAIFSLALKSITTYPVLMFCVREAIVSFYISIRGYDAERAARSEPIRRCIIVSLLWLCSVFAAILSSNIDTVVRLLGSLAVFFIFILPGLCLFSNGVELHDSGASSCKVFLLRLLSIGYVALGTFTFGLSLSLAVESILYSPSGNHQLCIPFSNTSHTITSRHFLPAFYQRQL